MSRDGAQPRVAKTSSALAFALLFALQIACLVRMRSPVLVDDAPFFFRYAENIAAGHGFRFNVEEPPVWGASAPLWPLLLALGVKLGLAPEQASLVWGWVLTLAATGLLGVALHRLAGSLGVMALAPLLAVNYHYSFYATAGLESPLGYFLLAGALAAIAYDASGPVLGLAAGLCLVHKIDFAPVGLAVLAGAWRWRRPVAARTTIVASAVAVAWYGFALWHFGSVVPNSLLRKMRMTDGVIGPSWFSATLLWKGGGALLLALLPFGLVALRRHGFLAFATLAAFVPQLVVYTLKPPPEPYEWYAAACAPAVAFLAACGLSWLLRRPLGFLDARLSTVVGAAAVLLVAWLAAGLERPRVRGMARYLRTIEPLRAQAGDWVAQNTPADARVYVGFGHVAYRSRRFVYDGSFLNRPFEENLIGKYAPEILVWVLTQPEHRVPPLPDYRVAKVFDLPGRERPLACVMERIARVESEVPRAAPRPAWKRILFEEISPEHRADVRSYCLAALGRGSPQTDPSPAVLAELSRALAELRARTEAREDDLPPWFRRLEVRVAWELGRELPQPSLPR